MTRALTGDLPVSVVIVSHGRPKALRRAVIGVSQLQYAQFEIVVVADAPGLDALRDLPEAAHIKTARFDTANISAARNIGIGLSGGAVVAFLDDDAVPEPSWLLDLTAPFADPGIAATGGYVRGRNGISFQWRGRRVNRLGETEPHEPGTPLPDGWAIKTEGTNMAVRRSVLAELDGFDECYRFFLDETDLNLRLAAAGYKTAQTPLAEVHHGYMASTRRRTDRVPRDLFEIGASWAAFLKKHAPDQALQDGLRQKARHERARLDRHLVTGALEPRDLRRLMARFDAGVQDGQQREAPVPAFGESLRFSPFPARPRTSIVRVCRPWSAARMRNLATEAVKKDQIVTVMIFSSSAIFHHVRFSDTGVWEQSGGVFGRSVRTQPLISLWNRKKRAAWEKNRVSHQRQIFDK